MQQLRLQTAFLRLVIFISFCSGGLSLRCSSCLVISSLKSFNLPIIPCMIYSVLGLSAALLYFEIPAASLQKNANLSGRASIRRGDHALFYNGITSGPKPVPREQACDIPTPATHAIHEVAGLAVPGDHSLPKCGCTGRIRHPLRRLCCQTPVQYWLFPTGFA